MAVKTLIEVGRYQCHRKLGSGGMAEIYQARVTGALNFSKEVAVKLMHRHLSTNPAIVELFVNEAKITATLDHPNIVTVFELGEHEGNLFMVMELVEGLDLGAFLARLKARGQTVPGNLALAIAIEVTKALQFVHACAPGRRDHAPPIIHRDLSPGNIMLSRFGAVKLLDFGVAKTLLGDEDTESIARGKWHYMSPEQVRGERLDGRSDLFSLGAVFFEMLTGRQAFRGQTVVDSMRKVEQADLPPVPGIEPVLEELLNTLLARERSARYANASEALDAMVQLLILRGSATGERQIADFLDRLDKGDPAPGDRSTPAPRRRSREDAQAFFGDDEHPDIQTIPQREPPQAVRASSEEPAAETTAPHGRKPTGQPPDVGSPRAEQSAGPSPASLQEFDDDEPTAVTVEQPPDPAAGRVNGSQHDTPGEDLSPDPPPTAEPFSPQLDLEHYMPTDPVQRVTVRPRVWTGRNLVILALALLALLIAGIAILIATRRQNARSPSRAASTRSAVRNAEPDAQVARPVIDATAERVAADAAKPRPVMLAKDPPSPGARPAPGTTPSAHPSLPIHGPPRQGELDVQTIPKGAKVFVSGILRGTSPLRVRLPPGRRYALVLSTPGLGLYRSPVWLPPTHGRRVKIMLQTLSRRLHKAGPGRTSIQVTCRTKGLYRIYIDGRDTGFDCPTPPIAVLPVIHSVSMYMPTQNKTVWKKLRPRLRQLSVIDWPY
ncbi:MAG: protein kinase [bacterium]